MILFDVTFEITSEESAEAGDFEETGFIGEGLRLRDAVYEVQRTRTSLVGGVSAISCDSWPCVAPLWVTISNGMEFETGDQESRSLHFPDSVTPASRRRIARLLGATV